MRCSTGSPYFSQCHNISATSPVELKCHVAKKHSVSKSILIHEGQECGNNFPVSTQRITTKFNTKT